MHFQMARYNLYFDHISYLLLPFVLSVDILNCVFNKGQIVLFQFSGKVTNQSIQTDASPYNKNIISAFIYFVRTCPLFVYILYVRLGSHKVSPRVTFLPTDFILSIVDITIFEPTSQEVCMLWCIQLNIKLYSKDSTVYNIRL